MGRGTRAEASAATVDVKGAWTPGPSGPNLMEWARSNGRESAEYFLEAQKVKSYGELIGENDLIKAADDVIANVTRATEIRAAAARGGNVYARAGLQAAADAGLDMAKLALDELAVRPAVGGAAARAAVSEDSMLGGVGGMLAGTVVVEFALANTSGGDGNWVAPLLDHTLGHGVLGAMIGWGIENGLESIGATGLAHYMFRDSFGAAFTCAGVPEHAMCR